MMQTPKSPEEGLNNILLHANNNPDSIPNDLVKQAIEALTTTQAGQKILEKHINNKTLANIIEHASSQTIPDNSKKPSSSASLVDNVTNEETVHTHK